MAKVKNKMAAICLIKNMVGYKNIEILPIIELMAGRDYTFSRISQLITEARRDILNA